MKTYVVIFIESDWASWDVDNNEFETRLKFDSETTLITFQHSDLVRELVARQCKSWPIIINVESLDTQMSQRGKDAKGNIKWNILACLRHHEIISYDFKVHKDNVTDFLGYVACLYKELIHNAEETSRYHEIEIAINKLLLDRQVKGIKVNPSLVREKCIKLDEYIYLIKNKLQLLHNIISPDDHDVQIEYLNRKGYNITNSLLNTFKNHKQYDSVCNLFYELIRSQQDLDSLLYILAHWGGQERTYPTFIGFGTITSRITMREPSLQNLRKTNRDVIIADNGKRLLYVDYSQFEAGILACLSKDKELVALYESDVYSDLAKKVLGDETKRKEAKIIFYRYMYGDDNMNREYLSYFNAFKSLTKFIVSIKDEATANGKIGTIRGNYRSCNHEDAKWILSHKIQATASLIYKRALLRVFEQVKEAEFLIPMHDGTVYQINIDHYDETKERIENIYKEELKKVCKEITPRLNSSDIF